MNIIKIDDEIGYWGISAYQVKSQLENMSGDITVEINSPGGSVYEGIAIFNALKAYDKGNVETIIVGQAASMASYIALAGDTIKAYDNAVYMIHNASVCLCGDFNYLRKRADVLEGLSSIIKNAYISKTSKSSEDLQKMMDEETYFFGTEILENGFVDEIIETSNTNDDSNQSKALASESFKACMEHVQMNTKEDKELIAAISKEYENKAVGTNPSKKEQIETKSKGEKMAISKEDFIALEQRDPEAFKALVGGAVSDAVAAETTRVTEIIALGGNSDFTAKAIEDGTTVGDAAIALLKSNETALAKKKTDFENAGDEVNGLEQAKETDDTPEALAQKKWEDAVKAKYGGDKK